MTGLRWESWLESLLKCLEFHAKFLHLVMVNEEPWKVLKNSEITEAVPENQYSTTV